MHVLIVHQEAQYFAGAEKMLGYFLDGLVGSRADVTVAAVADSRTAGVIPGGLPTCWLPSNARFSPLSFWRQAQTLRMAFRTKPFDVIHGWAARDWELTALTARLTRRPALGTLHDHPRASFISRARQRLMFWSAFAGLRKVVCVSEAVRRACLDAGYRQDQLLVVHNGLPAASVVGTPRMGAAFRLGFLGLFAERKGLKGLFQILSELSAMTDSPWEIALAGDAQDEQGRELIQELKARFSTATWWPRVQWCGWVKRLNEFLSSLDLLICPSSEFDPFPTVLLEAGQAGVAVLAARVGGVGEIVEDGGTGWLFEAQAWREAAEKLKQVLASPGLARQAGQAAKKRVEGEFAIEKMVADYLRIYGNLSRNK
jgi:glycosyltransferase involved in cell wall biosynthesis